MSKFFPLLPDTVVQHNRLLCFKSSLVGEPLLAHRFHAREAVGMPSIIEPSRAVKRRRCDR